MVLVGEIRDIETAEIAIQASLTGHLVFSTLHTNDAPTALTRLVDMGIEPYLVASSLEAVAAQRLVRVICSECKEPIPESEVAPLEAVIVHSPGPEIEAMTPRTAGELLFHGIIPLAAVSDEHRRLVDFLSRVCRVHELTYLLAKAVEDESTRTRLIEQVVAADVADPALAARVRADLLSLDPAALADSLVRGLPARIDSLEAALSGRQYDLPPLPNLYFMRDAAVVIGDAVAIAAMTHRVRRREALLVRAALQAAGASELEFATSAPDLRLEGGDILVVRPDLIVAGVSPRTSASGLDALVSALAGRRGEPITVIAAVLPDERSTIHLDMVFTLVDRDAAVVYEPLVSGPRRMEVYRLAVDGEQRSVGREEGLLPALARAGVDLEPIPCGGNDPVVREREQWLSGANLFAFGPGRAIAYDCNPATIDACARAGFRVVAIDRAVDVLLAADDRTGAGRVLVTMPGTNLARGGGGPRCMTLPIRRR